MRETPNDWQQRSQPLTRWPGVVLLMVACGIVFVLQNVPLLFPHFDFNNYFALSLDGMKARHYWQLITYQFMHAGLLHIVLNLWAIWMFGRVVESALGWQRMLALFLLGGIAGGGLQMIGAACWPDHFGGAVVGASAGAYGLVAAFAVLFPQERLMMLLFVVPVPMRARTLLWVASVAALAGIVVPYGNIAHAAHFGGIVVGVLLAEPLARSRRAPRPTAW